ncbi:MAG TPA: hypothetical protein VGF89_13240 [Steroidobacteraceae bacterium]|jgi:hypothetical protein
MSGSAASMFDLASLADYVYTPAQTGLIPASWTVLLSSQVGGRNPYQSQLYGFYAEAFKNPSTQEIVVAIRGTQQVQNYLSDLTRSVGDYELPA